MESLRKGLSGMDAAKAAMGQGWPFAAGPWSNDGTKEVSRSETRMSGVLSLWLLSLCTSKEKVTRHKGEKRGYGTLAMQNLPSSF
ncbi:hypothetical protein [Pseudomonas sp. SO81]|uniref:hypothetical protein n=1 Tax=Pseudomonas sp. SO81 TaxID=2983246 RepID=UPI0025A33E46|nr:hypothetical protein [Pseudomonas sp. SO81]WJN58535.1 hypothetical protein OH686_07285 [Pseudomonas sp. SO81]